MRYALLLLLCTGCNATAAVDHASIIADIAVRYAAIVCRQQSQRQTSRKKAVSPAVAATALARRKAATAWRS
jgi:hypothetical protein